MIAEEEKPAPGGIQTHDSNFWATTAAWQRG